MHKSDLIAVGAVLGLAAASCARAEDELKSPDQAPPPPPEAGSKVQLASADLGGLNTLLPVGKTARKVVVPSIDEDGVLTSVTRMGRITRIDEDHFALENVLLRSFDVDKIDPATGKPEITAVKISKGIYVSSERKLTSDRPVHITKPGLETIGESLVYWSVEGHAVLKGHSETVLTDLQAPAPPPDADEPTSPDTTLPDEGDSSPDPIADPAVSPQTKPQ